MSNIRKIGFAAFCLFLVGLGYAAPTKDDCFSTLITKANDMAHQYSVSPNRKWVLEIVSNTDSADLFIFQYCDTSAKTKVVTVKKGSGSGSFNMRFPEYSYQSIVLASWTTGLDTAYILLWNSELNPTATGPEVFLVDLSSVTASAGKRLAKQSLPKQLTATNYPNPFNPTTTIQYALPEENYVAVNIYDSKGSLLRVLGQVRQKAGTHKLQWDGKDNGGKTMPSGEYYYQVVSGRFIGVKKALLLK